MSLKKRLILSNASIVMIPISITGLLALVFIYLSYTFGGTTIRYKDFEQLVHIRQEFLVSAERIWEETPETLVQSEFQQYLTVRLSGIEAEVCVLKHDETVYSTINLNQETITQALAIKPGVFSIETLRIGPMTYMCNLHPFSFTDGATGSILLMAPVDNSIISAEQFLIFVVIIFLSTFLLTNILFSIRLSKSIAAPLTHLKTSVQEIIRGNLNTRVIQEGEEEIREVSRALEKMRVKLEESIDTQLKYDDNRKMLVSSISHDLKTPITSIKGYVEGILDGVANTPEKSRKYLETVYAKATQMDGMIDDLLLYSKLDLNQLPYNFEITDITAYFEDCIRESEADMEKSGIRIQLDNTLSNKRFVRIDRERMKRVVLNLFDNAVKYMNKPSGEITVILRETNTTVITEVCDNGSGIPAANLPLIFDRFYRSDAARSKAGGSGLGLAIAKQIVEDHEGRIWVRSIEGEGTHFMIALAKQDHHVDQEDGIG